MRHMHRVRGFTLIELVITMAVLAVGLLVAMPSIGVWLDNTRIRSAAEGLQAGLQTARMEAVRRNQSVSFYLVSLTNGSTMDNSCALSSSSGSWVINTSSPAGKCGNASILGSRAIGSSSSGVKISAGSSSNTSDKTDVGTAATTTTFDGLGRLDTTSSPLNRVRITGPKTDTTYLDLMVIVETGGGVRICDPRSSIQTNDPRKC